MSLVYVTISRMHVRNVNAQPVWWLVGPPGPLAYLGFAHALARECCESITPGVAIVHHDFRLQAFRGKRNAKIGIHPHQFRGASLINADDYAGGGKSLSLQPTVRGDLVASVILSFPHDAPLDIQRLRDFMKSARLGGGSVLSHDRVADPVDTLEEAMDAVRTGFVVRDRSMLLNDRSTDQSVIDRFMEITRPPALTNVLQGRRPWEAEAVLAPGQSATESPLQAEAGEPSEDNVSTPSQDQEQEASKALAQRSKAKSEKTWILPAALGYALLTEARQRSMARDGYPHAFAEPLVGLVQYQSIHRLRADPAPPTLAFWRYANPCGHDDVYVAQHD